MGTSRSRRCLHDSRGSDCGRCVVRLAPEIRITHPRSARVLSRLVIPIDVRMSLSCHVHGARRAVCDEDDPLSRREPFVSSREASEDPPHDPIVHQAQGRRKGSARTRCREHAAKEQERALRGESCSAPAPILERARSASALGRRRASFGDGVLLLPSRPLSLRHLANHEIPRRNLRAHVVELCLASIVLSLCTSLRHCLSLAATSPVARAAVANARRMRNLSRRSCPRCGR